MKVKDIAKHYNIDSKEFSTWLWSSGYSYKTLPMGGVDVTDGQDINAIVEAFRSHKATEEQASAQAAQQQQLAEQQKQQALANMIITSGFSFDGYTITKYSGYISGDDVTQIQRDSVAWLDSGTGGKTGVGDRLTDALVKIRRQAMAELKEAAWALGCNAVIGVDFDYLTLEPETATMNGKTKYLPYVVCVTANGNAVVVERNRPTALS